MTKPQTKPQTSRRAFTLTEALVAVIAVAIISVGLAAIFASVGDTVQRGRQISAINQYAAAIERRIRNDLAGVTRDGFLVIRNEYAGFANEDPRDQLIPLSDESLDSRRLRRIDELLFFARGDFTTARGSIDGTTAAPRSTDARIYYGHGERQVEGAEGFFRPFLSDPNAANVQGAERPWSLGLVKYPGLPALGAQNPNRFAGDWTLLRHATLLKTPSLPFNDGSFTDDEINLLSDNRLQIGRQIAADSVFRSEAFWGEPTDAGNFQDFSIREIDNPPTFPSGVVDIATESFPEIRRRVMGLAVAFSQFQTSGTGGNSGGGGAPRVYFDTPASEFEREDRPPLWQLPRRNGTPSTPTLLYQTQSDLALDDDPSNDVVFVENDARQNLVHLQHAWMADALPAASNELTYTGPQASDPPIPDLQRVLRDVPGASSPSVEFLADPLYALRSRMRYESTPPGYNADVFGPDARTDFDSPLGAFRLAGARADQQMVTNSQFIPRCTEFIVEWSYGERYTRERLDDLLEDRADELELEGELVWYGSPRPTGSGVPISSLRPAQPLRPLQLLIDDDLAPGETPTAASRLREDQQRLLERHLRANLILGDDTGSFADQRNEPPDPTDTSGFADSAAQSPTTFFFGYADPRAVAVSDFVTNPATGETEPNEGFDLNGDGYRDDLDADGVFDDAWPWPRLLRITLSFADPIDQTTEETFQFVVELPSNGDF
ncbi:MAG: type II secretion system protein [Planctomycetota bacterium]